MENRYWSETFTLTTSCCQEDSCRFCLGFAKTHRQHVHMVFVLERWLSNMNLAEGESVAKVRHCRVLQLVVKIGGAPMNRTTLAIR